MLITIKPLLMYSSRGGRSKLPYQNLLHQKNWKVVSMQAERKSDGEVLDWYSQLPSCVKDNIFITEAPGTGAVGELHGEEGGVFVGKMILSISLTSLDGNSTSSITFSQFLFLPPVTVCSTAMQCKNLVTMRIG